MKSTVSLGLLALTFSAFAQTDIDNQIEKRVEVLSQKVTSQAQHLRLSRIDKAALLENLKNSLKILNAQGTGNGPGPSPTPFPSPGPGPGYYTPNMVQTYADNYCSVLITPITERDNCSLLTNVYRSRNVLSVKVNEKCFNINDRTFADSCTALQPLAIEPVIKESVADLYADNYCSVPVISLDPSVRYESWAPVLAGTNILSVKVENRCQNINDVAYTTQVANNFLNAAMVMRGRQDPRDEVIELFADNYCSVNVTNVQRGNDCPALSSFYGQSNVLSIKFRGRCENIADMTFINACQTYAR